MTVLMACWSLYLFPHPHICLPCSLPLLYANVNSQLNNRLRVGILFSWFLWVEDLVFPFPNIVWTFSHAPLKECDKFSESMSVWNFCFDRQIGHWNLHWNPPPLELWRHQCIFFQLPVLLMKGLKSGVFFKDRFFFFFPYVFNGGFREF